MPALVCRALALNADTSRALIEMRFVAECMKALAEIIKTVFLSYTVRIN
jgi:hypothetical protein